MYYDVAPVSPPPSLKCLEVLARAIYLKIGPVLLIEAHGPNLKFNTRKIGSCASPRAQPRVITINVGLLIIAKGSQAPEMITSAKCINTAC